MSCVFVSLLFIGHVLSRAAALTFKTDRRLNATDSKIALSEELERSLGQLVLDGRRPYMILKDLRPQPFVFCGLPGESLEPWLRLMLRALGRHSWNETDDDSLRKAFATELEFVGPTVDQLMATTPARQRVSQILINTVGNSAPGNIALGLDPAQLKAAMVRDPVTRLLDAYLRQCRDMGAWERCQSSGPLFFGQAVAALEEAGLQTADPSFMQQVDICGRFDLVGRFENFDQDSRMILNRAGLWDRVGRTGWGLMRDAGFGETFRDLGASDRVCSFYTPKLLERVGRLYSRDFDAYQYDIGAWTKKCAVEWWTLTDATASVHRRPLPSLAGSLPLEGRSICAPTAVELLKASGLRSPSPTPPKLIKFFLHDAGAFNITGAVDCFLRSQGVRNSVDDWDDHLPANVAEHLAELWLLRSLSSHSQRTRIASEADLHIIGVPFFTSYMAAQPKDNSHVCGDSTNHLDRMNRVAVAMLKLPSFQRFKGQDFFVFTTHYSISKVFTPSILDVLNRGNVIVGTADQDYVQWAALPGIRRKVILPYKAHHLLDTAAGPPTPVEASKKRTTNYLFHGSMDRRHEGRGRAVLVSLSSYLRSADVRDVTFLSEPPNITRGTAASYLLSRFCFVPAGDSPTSRRLYDALAAGCIPVVLGGFQRLMANLPFQRTIDWTQVLIFGGSLQCINTDLVKTATYLQDLADGNLSLTRRIREAGRDVFHEALSYRPDGGLATTLLKELAYELKNPTVA